MVLGAVGASSYAVTAVIGIVVFALAASMALLLSDGILKMRPLFAETKRPNRNGARGSRSRRHPLQAWHLKRRARSPRRKRADGAAPGVLDAKKAPSAQDWFREEFDLSERETEVALLIAQGRSKAYIADALCLSENTVRTHAKNVYAKLDVHSKQELIDLLQNRE